MSRQNASHRHSFASQKAVKWIKHADILELCLGHFLAIEKHLHKDFVLAHFITSLLL